jgi:hypothetical protein
MWLLQDFSKTVVWSTRKVFARRCWINAKGFTFLSGKPVNGSVVAGGLERLNEDGRDGTLMARAIITVRRDDGTSGCGTPRPSAPLSSHVRLRDRHRRPD